MRRRCNNPTYKQYPNYGGRGIKVAPEFETFNNYFNYITSLPGFSLALSLDRINNDGNYEPGNLRWADHTTQNLNRRVQRQHKNCKSGVIGLSWCTRDSLWVYNAEINRIRYRKQSRNIEDIGAYIAELLAKGVF